MLVIFIYFSLSDFIFGYPDGSIVVNLFSIERRSEIKTINGILQSQRFGAPIKINAYFRTSRKTGLFFTVVVVAVLFSAECRWCAHVRCTEIFTY